MTLKSSLCLICAAAALLSYGCSRRITAQRDLDQKLIAAIEKERTGDEPVIVRLKDLTTFEWDKFYVFHPYQHQRPEDIREPLGIDWDPETSIRWQDWDDLLVFVSRGKVVHYHDHPRKHGEFQFFRRTGYTPDEAVFEVGMDKQLGWLALKPFKSSKSSATP